MTAYNRAAYIGPAIESVLASTLKDFELIIVDDASKDQTLAIAQSYAEIDERIKVFANPQNLGQFANRNKAASLAKGKYLKFVDSDDIIYPFTLQTMVNGMTQFPEASIGFCLTHGDCKLPLPYLVSSIEAFQQHFFEGGLLFAPPTGTIIKREAFEAVKGFEEYGMPSDNHLSLKVGAKHPCVALTRDLFWWRIHEDQVFTQNKNNHYNILNNYNYNVDIIKNYSPLDAAQNKKVLFNLKKNYFKKLLQLGLVNGKPVAAIQIYLNLMKSKLN